MVNDRGIVTQQQLKNKSINFGINSAVSETNVPNAIFLTLSYLGIYMKLMFFIFFAFMSTASADNDFSGIWKDSQNQFYSIHQSDDSIVVAELSSQQSALHPFVQGNLIFTNNQLDLAISGHGFFIIERKDGKHIFTRKGHFFLAADGNIVNEQGEKLMMEKEMVFPDDNIVELVIEQNGTVNQRDPSGGLIKLNRIKLASIAPQDILYDREKRMTARNEKVVTYVYPAEEQSGVIQQGTLEMLDYISQEWIGYTGKLIDNHASIKSLAKTDNCSKEIIFENDLTANLKTTGYLGPIFPGHKSEDRQLIKVF